VVSQTRQRGVARVVLGKRGREMKKHRILWIAGIALVLAFSPVELAQAQTVTVASSPAWGGQHVCLNAIFPVACPPDATQYGYPFPGWSAPRPPGANWIWLKGVKGGTLGADLATASFSQTVVAAGPPVSGVICLAADDFAQLTVNNTVVGSVGSTTNLALAAAAQSTAACFDVTPYLQSGTNVIAVDGRNGPRSFSPFSSTGGCNPSCKYNENPAGVMFYGTLIFAVKEGRLTGGGTTPGTFDAGGMTLPVTVDIHQGLELHCDETQRPNNLEVNWDGGNHFRLDTLDSATCFDDPSKMPNPPPAGFDSYKGSGSGSCNGVPGATADWYFTDEGEPGTQDDVVSLSITCADGSTVTAAGQNNVQGNFQAHGP
jgi:hypothetical protein